MSSIPSNLTPQAFTDRWRRTTLKERPAYQEHFPGLCRLINHPTPAEVEPTGENFAFGYGAAYGRPSDLSADEVLARRLALNLARVAQQSGGA